MLIAVLGGIKSGKSRFAVSLAQADGSAVCVIATGLPVDAEMRQRIASHRRSRPAGWMVLEEPLRPVAALARAQNPHTILLDAVDTWLANRMEELGGSAARWTAGRKTRLERELATELGDLVAAAPHVIAVSNEVGMAPVALSPYGRAFADLLGGLNQRLFALARERYLMVAGVALRVG